MDIYQFITSLVNSIAWPATIIFLVIFFRKLIYKLILSLETLSFKDLKLNFHQELIRLEQVATKAQIPLSKREETQEFFYKKVIDLSQSSPIGAISLAWINVEEAVNQAIKRLNIKTSDSHISQIQKIRALASQPHFSSEILQIIEGLRFARNNVVHSQPSKESITEGDVVNFIELSENVITYLNNFKKE
jgi:hypothetical protein